ncbi:MAG TPA: DoxX family protein [Pyrinomonadaceae bacterium]|nr:DoxX family protein [Pyrinomonadaceae bacterium]
MSVDLGILLLRMLFGAAIAAHGAQKVFGWFGGYGLKGTGGFFESLGFRPGVLFASAAGLGELVGGLLLVLGLLTPLGGAAVLGTMLVAMFSVHLGKGFFASNNGIEMPLLYGAAALSLMFTGGGGYSLDAMLRLGWMNHPVVVAGVLGLTVISAALTLALRSQAQATTNP